MTDVDLSVLDYREENVKPIWKSFISYVETEGSCLVAEATRHVLSGVDTGYRDATVRKRIIPGLRRVAEAEGVIETEDVVDEDSKGKVNLQYRIHWTGDSQ